MARGLHIGAILFCLLLPLSSAGAAASTAQEALEVSSQAAPGLDQPIQPHPAGDEAIQQLRSPFCPGLMLEICPTPAAKLLRDSLQMMAWEGANSDSIVNWMLASYGSEYRGVPLTRGGGLWAWLMPPLMLLAGFLAVTLALRHFRRGREVGPQPTTPLSEEDETLLAAALEELKASEEVAF